MYAQNFLLISCTLVDVNLKLTALLPVDCRAEYDPKNDLLDEEFMLKGKWYQRRDVEVSTVVMNLLLFSIKVRSLN